MIWQQILKIFWKELQMTWKKWNNYKVYTRNRNIIKEFRLNFQLDYLYDMELKWNIIINLHFTNVKSGAKLNIHSNC